MATTFGAVRAQPEAVVESSTDSTTPGRGTKKYNKTVKSLLTVCDSNGLNFDSLTALLQDSSMAGAVEYVFGLTDRVPRRTLLSQLVKQVEERLDLQDPLEEDLAPMGVKIVRVVRAVFSGMVLALSMWTVIGAILDQSNAMSADTSPTFTLGVLVVALAALALLEAAHIGAVALSTADVSELQSQYPRVYRLHRHISTPTKLEHYLAARQVGVVMIVFVVAEVTRTVGLRYLPGTAIELPSAASLVFQIGVPGALMVLIIGQVAPQLLTARRPARLMNSLPMATAFHATRAIGHLGLAGPASWLVAFSTSTERIASAKPQRYKDITVDVLGMGVQSIIRELRVSPTVTQSITQSTMLLYEGGRTHLHDRSATVPIVPSAGAVPAVTIQRSGSWEDAMVTFEQVHDPTGRSATMWEITARPTLGAFEARDLVSFSLRAAGDGAAIRDSLIISEPTKLAMMRVVLEDPPTPLPPAKMTLERDDDGMLLERADVNPVRTVDGKVEFVAAVNYPDPGTILTLAWGVEDSNS